MIFHNSNEEYPQPLSMFTQKEWDELGSGHLSSDTILDFFDLPPDKVAEYKEKGYVGVYAPYSLVSNIANKTLPGNHKQWFFLDNILNNMDIQAINRKRVDLLIKDEGYYIYRVELDFAFMPEKQISKVVSSIAESLKGSKCDVVRSFQRVYIVFNDILQTKSASEDNSVVPLSMFSKEQWEELKTSESLTRDNVHMVFPEYHVLNSGVDWITMSVEDKDKVLDVVDTYKSNLVQPPNDIYELVNYGKWHNMRSIRFTIRIYKGVFDSEIYWSVNDIVFYFHTKESMEGFIHDKGVLNITKDFKLMTYPFMVKAFL